MSALPPELAPWAEALAGFAPDLAEVVGQLARRLDVLFGRVRARPRPRGDDPDGYDGLDRRGPYDRLLLSEWALADALPEEFDRRAVSGEHAFLRLDRRDRAKGVRSLALFDAGPDNLGGPRMVQLAALIVLWRRALAAGAGFSWGMLQTGALAATVDRGSIQAFLAGRSARASTPADLARLRAAAGESDELWIVGAPPDVVDAAGPAALRLSLSDVVALDANAVDVRLERGATRYGDARLDLPAPGLGRRLLTDPFPAPPPRASPSRKAKPAPDSRAEWLPLPRGTKDPWLVRFVAGTRKLLVGVSGPTVLAWNFEGDALTSPKPRSVPIHFEDLVAVGYGRKQVETITRTKEGEVRHWFGTARPAPNGVPPALGNGVVVARPDLTAFADAAGALFLEPKGGAWTRLDGRAELLFPHHGELLGVIERGDGLFLVRFRPGGGTDAIARLPGARAWVGAWPHTPSHPCVLLTRPTPETVHAAALDGLAGAWTLRRIPMDHVRVHPDEELLGVGFPRPGEAKGPQVAPISWNPKSGAILHTGTAVRVTPARVPIDLAVSPDGHVVAWRTPEGFVEAWSLLTGDPLLLRYGG